MSEQFEGSASLRLLADIEPGNGDVDDNDEASLSPFDIYRTKNASVNQLKGWRKATLVLNASRRFRFTLDLKKEAEKEKIMRKIKAHTQVIVAAYIFRAAGQKDNGAEKLHPTPEELATISRLRDFSALQKYGGVTRLADILKTNLEKGIQGDDVDLSNRRNIYGSNTYPKKKRRSFWRFLWEACRDKTLIILMIATIASLGLRIKTKVRPSKIISMVSTAVALVLGIKTKDVKEELYDGGSIILVVVIVIVVTATVDYRQYLQFQTLNEEKQNIHLEVVRGGRRLEVSIFDLVVGDIVPINIGDQVPADGILVSRDSLAIDESSMTGESKIVYKDLKAPFLMSGCKVADGCGTMLVTSVGLNTEWGLLMTSISEDTGEETPLQVHLNGVATLTGIVGLTVASAVLVVLVIRFFTGHTKNPDGSVQFKAGMTKFSDAINGAIDIFIVSVTIVLVAVPEGLPLAVTSALPYSMRKMMTEKALVRRLSACETMGSATKICCDKTGTLTKNQMTLVEAYVGGRKIDDPNNSSLLPPEVKSLLIEAIAQNTTGSVFMPEGVGDAEISGSPTEKAILQWGVNIGMNFDTVRSDSSIIQVFPFNSEKKRRGVALKLPDHGVRIHWKGAAEIVLALCTKYIDANGGFVSIDEDEVKKAIDDMAARSLRCVTIAYRSYEMGMDPTNEEEQNSWKIPEDDLVLLAIVGLKDPCRPGVKDAVQLCTDMGVKVCMVTGDNLQTAKAIALECGILGSDADATEPNIIEGKAFRALSEVQRQEISEQISVMGRSSPNDKLLLVQALRKRGHVVAVTGDGSSDAPALHEADIGLAMGIQGTEVAKESSDIVILDDNFVSVVKVVRWGRSVYANIQKFVQFGLTVNVAALVINVVAVISSGDVPLNGVQLLWVNLIVDTLGALALATEPPTDHLMPRFPVLRREPLITNIMWRNLLIQALYQVAVVLVLNLQGRSLLYLEHDNITHANKVKNTLIFNAFVLCQIFNEFNARRPNEINVFKEVTRNHLFMGIVGLTLALQVIMIMFLGKITSTVRLTWKLWLVSVAIAFFSWPLAIIGKLIPVPEMPFSQLLARMLIRRRNFSDVEARGGTWI